MSFEGKVLLGFFYWMGMKYLKLPVFIDIQTILQMFKYVLFLNRLNHYFLTSVFWELLEIGSCV